MSDAIPLVHPDCWGCMASAWSSTDSAETGGLIMLAFIRGGHRAEDLERQLCFQHRRQLRDAAEAVREILAAR